MQITSVTTSGRSHTAIEIDGEQILVLTRRQADAVQPQQGMELSEQVYEELLEQIRKDASQRCADLLKNRDYTAREMADRLRRRAYPESIIMETVREAQRSGLIDDRRYAIHYLEYYGSQRSRLRMKSELQGKGISGSVLEEVISVWEEENREDITEKERAQIRSFLQKRHYDPDTEDPQERAKLWNGLLGKGYPPELIREVLSEEIS